VHLGAPLGWLGARASDQREQLRQTFRSIIDLTIQEDADCLIIAGDLFDSNRPPGSAVRFVLRELARLGDSSETYTVILPGSHDHMGDGSVFSCYSNEFAQIERVHILGAHDVRSVVIPRASLVVHGDPPRSNSSSEHRLAKLRPQADHEYNVAVAHGSVDVVPVEPEDHPISRDELLAPGWSYFALGHWHSWREIEGKGAPAVYPGAPEVIAADQAGSGHVARISLGGEGVEVTKVRVGARTVSSVQIDVGGAMDTDEVARRVATEHPKDVNAILSMTLTGLMPVGSGFEPEALLEVLKPDYFHVRLPRLNYEVRLSHDDLEALPERLVIGRFVRLMKEQIDAAEDSNDREDLEAALQMGVALLQGKDVLA
jgi:DNA repair exonuclease SbcCD nuclease subunit